MKIVLRPHLKIRLKERLIPKAHLHKIITAPDIRFNDTETHHKIAIKSLEYNLKVRPMVASYDIIKGEIQVITIYPTTLKEVENRLKSGRWIKDETD
jgi:hypothetical protein